MSLPSTSSDDRLDFIKIINEKLCDEDSCYVVINDNKKYCPLHQNEYCIINQDPEQNLEYVLE